MGGGLIQLVAYGAQDVYLTGNPQVTHFKTIYRRHTNFAIESVRQTFNENPDWGRKIHTIVSRNGDLINKAYIKIRLPSVTVAAGTSFRWLNWIGQVLIKTIELEIGGQRIDKLYSDWIHIWNELSLPNDKQLAYAKMVGNSGRINNPVAGPATVAGETLYVPLDFFWNRSPGLALPLIALQYHEVRINIELNQLANCYWSGSVATGSPTTTMTGVTIGSLEECTMYIDYIYLDTDERRKFAQSSHEYLIEQLQYTGDESATGTNTNVKLDLNHPVKEIVWVVQRDTNVSSNAPWGKQWFNYTDEYDYSLSGTTSSSTVGSYASSNISGSGSGVLPGLATGSANNIYVPTSFDVGRNPINTAVLKLNGYDRFTERDSDFFNVIQPFQHHTNVPSCGINVYSFALRADEHQPSGTCNFSRIDNANLVMNLTSNALSAGNCTVRVYATNYNILRIMSGMAGVAFSN